MDGPYYAALFKKESYVTDPFFLSAILHSFDSSMALTDSSIQSWLTFNGTLPPIQHCNFVNHSMAQLYYQSNYQPNLTQTDCSNVCNDSISLFEPTNNRTLVTCGLWTTLVSSMSLTSDESGNHLLPPNDTQSLSLLKEFNAVGLDQDMVQYTQSYADTISDCLVEIYSDVKELSYADDGTMPANCSENDIFPFGTNLSSAGWKDTVKSLNTCMNRSMFLQLPVYLFCTKYLSLQMFE